MISTGVIWFCFFVFNFLFDIRERPENAIKTSESGRVCKYATPESEQIKAKGCRTSISPAKKLWTYVLGSVDVRSKGACTYGVRGWGRTSRGCLDVRARNLWTVQNGTERFASWNTAQKTLCCAAFEPHLFPDCVRWPSFFECQNVILSQGQGNPES